MSDIIAASLISGSALVVVAILTFGFNRAQDRKAAWRDKKLEYYAALMDALARRVADDDVDADYDFAREFNNIHLVAPRPVLKALHAFGSYTKAASQDVEMSVHNSLLADLLKAMRDDMGMPRANEIDGKHVQLWKTARSRNPFSKQSR
jgi:hypothetical protein